MRINHNIAALNTHRQLNSATGAQGKSMEKLASGLRINRAGDDAAGLSISEKMRGQIRGLEQASRNAQDGISLIQTAEGALNETHDILQRMRELAVQASNDTNDVIDRDAIKEEIDALATEITRIGESTEFNQKKLLNGDLSTSVDASGAADALANGVIDFKTSGTPAGNYTVSVSGTEITMSNGTDSQIINIGSAPTGTDTKDVTFGQFGATITINSQLADNSANNTFAVTATGEINLQIGANSSNPEKMTISIDDMRASALGVEALDMDSHTNAKTSLDAINTAINTVSTQRSKLGAFQNRLEHTINNLGTSAENLTAAESRVRDVDMAKEMMNQTKNSILSQAAQAMLAQSNQMPQGVLQLLR